MASLTLRNCLHLTRGIAFRPLGNVRNFHITAATRALPQGEERQKFIDEGMTEMVVAEEKNATELKEYVTKTAERWNKYYDIYYGKDRDTENFPILKRPMYPPKVRMGLIPDAWFRAFYPVSGTLGPYAFLTGLTTFLLSKEYIVCMTEANQVIPFIMIVTFAIKKWGPMVSDWHQKRLVSIDDYLFNRPLDRHRQKAQFQLEKANINLTNLEALKDNFAAKKEQVDLQLEAVYRLRMAEFSRLVKRRLDYHIERENTRRRFQQQHMVRWIVNNVVKSITPQQEKETLNKCIADLKAMSARV